MFGACEKHEEPEDTTEDALQVNHIRANTKDDEALTNSMSILAISDFDPTSVVKDQDWLYGSYDISAISSTVPQSCWTPSPSIPRTTTEISTNQKEEFEPWDPDLNTSTQPM